jgi:polyisoprenyl-teichoic acid--peptidoglycan teichoic acid transferase
MTLARVAGWFAFIVLCFSPFVAAAQDDDVPEAVPLIDELGQDIVNFLLIGSDTFNAANVGRSDVILVVSVNRSAGTVAMLSIPRDLYVYIPSDRTYRINTAYSVGETNGYAGGGPAALADTIRHNLGLEIDYYARVDFNDFRRIIDNLGGAEIVVDCAIEDWRLIEPDLDPELEENWAMFTLPVGVHTMDGDLALWYARSRRTSSDLDRGRRQQALMRALLSRIRELDLLTQLSDIWPQVLESVDTNIPLSVMLDLIPLAVNLDSTRIASYTFRSGIEVRGSVSPEGSSVLVPEPDAVRAMLDQMMVPPTENRLQSGQTHIEIVNATGISGMGRVAAARLMWEGFQVTVLPAAATYQGYTELIDYTGQSKGSTIDALAALLRLSDDAVTSEPTAERTADYRVVLGGNYYPCTYSVVPPGADT